MESDEINIPEKGNIKASQSFSETKEQSKTSSQQIENPNSQLKTKTSLFVILIIVIVLAGIATFYFLKANSIPSPSPSTIAQTPIATITSTPTKVSEFDNIIQREGKWIEPPTKTSRVFIPKGATSQNLIAEVWGYVGCINPPNYRNTGNEIKLIFLESSNPRKLSSIENLLIPATVEIDIPEFANSHLNSSTLTIFNCPSVRVNPTYTIPLTTTVSNNGTIASAKVQGPGGYGLLAKLKCEEDISEYNDDYDFATQLTANEPLTQIFDIQTDQDWYAVDSTLNSNVMSIKINKLHSDILPEVVVYDRSGITPVKISDNLSPSSENLIYEIPSNSNVGFITVSPNTNSYIGCDANYEILIQKK